MRYTVVTTFNAQGYNLYGSKMIDTFLATWPREVGLHVYAEQCKVSQAAPNLTVLDLEVQCPDLVAFKQKWQSVPYARGDVSSIKRLRTRPDAAKSFKWDAIRFSHKVYSVYSCAQTVKTDWLLWMDADMVCHSKITAQDLDALCPEQYDIAFLGRGKKFSECGLYALNLNKTTTRQFLQDFVGMYKNAEQGIFTLDEWHDSYVFDHVRKRNQLNELDWSKNLFNGEGHPLINSDWGRWLDHLKGDRKSLGKSKAKDLRLQRSETYWRM